MRVLVNGTMREVPPSCSLEHLAPHQPGIAAAVNGLVIPGQDWGRTRLHDGDAIELLSAFQGG